MILFVLMSALALMAMLLLTRPWWSRSEAKQFQRRSANVAAYRTRLAELENEVASGLIEPEAAQVLRDELGARLLEDAEHSATDATQSHKTNLMWPVVLGLLLPTLALLGYFYADSWHIQQTIDEVAAHPESAQRLTIEAMVQRLERKLAKSPDDAEGWAMLGRSYFVMSRYPSAADAYHKANALNGGAQAEVLVAEGEALAMAHERDLQGEPAALFERALQLNANEGKALWYGGLAAAQVKNFKLAMQRWLRLRDQPDIPPEFAEVLETRLQELSQLSGLPVPAKQRLNAVAGVQLRLKVRITPELQKLLPDHATLLVYAKAENGPPMPLAVQKLTDFKLPLDVLLDDSMAMMPQLKLSSFPRWIVMARISTSGDVKAQPGDLQGQIAVDAAKASASQAIDLVISERIKAGPP
jgi:cytochrome c-type biogenesis protein CcmH